MTAEIFPARWDQIKTSIPLHWGGFSGDDINEINGNREAMIHKIRVIYGLNRAMAEEQLQAFENSLPRV
jgi:hypothetical protein